MTAPASAHEVRRDDLGVLVEAYALLAQWGREAQTSDHAAPSRPASADDQRITHDDRGSVGRVTPVVAGKDDRHEPSTTRS